MGILLAFALFVAFAVSDRLVGATEGLMVGAAVAAGLLVRNLITAGGTPKLLEIGTVVPFSALALYAVVGDPIWSIMGVRLRVDAGLLLIVLVSIVLQRPFTLQYARERVGREHWGSAVFLRTNYVITAAWALAFGVLVIADLVLLYLPDVPSSVSVVATILALVAAVTFTGWFPERVRINALR